MRKLIVAFRNSENLNFDAVCFLSGIYRSEAMCNSVTKDSQHVCAINSTLKLTVLPHREVHEIC